MNKLGCAVIRDLLPVYVSEEASEDTKLLVEEHLKECQSCRAELEILRQPIVLPPETEQTIISGIKKKRRRKRIRNFICFLLILSGVCAVSYSMYQDAAIELTASDLTVDTDAAGRIILVPDKRAENMLVHRIYTQDADGNTTVYLSLEKVNDVLLFLEDPIGWFTESTAKQQVPLDIYKVFQSEDGSFYLNSSASQNAGSESVAVLYGDTIVLDDSVTAVYYQPGIEHETKAFCRYMEELCTDATNSTNDLAASEKMICSKYQVPQSSERVLIYENKE